MVLPLPPSEDDEFDREYPWDYIYEPQAEDLLDGLIKANTRMRESGLDAVLQATATAFGFVYVQFFSSNVQQAFDYKDTMLPSGTAIRRDNGFVGKQSCKF